MARETRDCRYCTSANVFKNTHCRRCNRWLGPQESATAVPKAVHSRLTRWQRNLAVTAIAAVIAVGSPYIYSRLDGNSTKELAAPNPSASRFLPDSSPHSDISSNDINKQANRKVERERKQNAQIASRKR